MPRTPRLPWDTLAPRLGPLIQRFGFITAAEVAGIPQSQFRAMCEAMRNRGHACGRHIGFRTPEQRAAEVRAAQAWEAAGPPCQHTQPTQPAPTTHQQAGSRPVKRPTRPELNAHRPRLVSPAQAAPRKPAQPAKAEPTVVYPANVRHTIAPTPGSRFAPAPGYVGTFSRTAPGIDPLTREEWA